MMAYIVLSVACIIILHYIGKTLHLIWLKPRKLENQLRKQGLLGNSYKVFYGDLKENYKMRSEAQNKTIPFHNDYYARVFPHLDQLANKYGENSFMWLGSTPFIHITNPSLISEALSRTYEFQKIDSNPLINTLFCGLVSYEQQIWDVHRKLLNPAFHLQKLRLMPSAVSASVTNLVNKWDTLLSKTSSCEIDVCPDLTMVTADVISRVAYSSTYEEGKRIFELITELQKHIAPIINTVYIPGWEYVPTKRNKKIQEDNAELESLLKKVVDKREKSMKDGEKNEEDMLRILIQSNLQKNNRGINFKELIDECKLFFFSGHETTSMLLSWTLLLLGKHQSWQIKARDEVLATFGMNPPDFDGIQRLKIVKMILNEVLRLYPPAPAVTRLTRAGDTTLGNLYLPKDVIIGLSFIDAHHNPKYWGDDVKEFNPERFAEGTRKAANEEMAFFPFGWGPRYCIGQNFSLIEAKMILSIILQRFCFEVSPSYIHAPIGVITLKPQHGAHIILRRV